MSLMVSSTRPVQAIMSTAGVAATAGITSAFMHERWTPFDQLASMITIPGVIIMFVLYSLLSFHAALTNHHHKPYKQLKYLALFFGITLWTFALSSSFHYTPDGFVMTHTMSFMYFIPLSADMWVLTQLVAGVEKIERRRWK